MKPDMRICRGECDIVAGKWSADRTALLVIEECAECRGTGQGPTVPAACPEPERYGPNMSCLVAHFESSPCPKCGGEGWQYAAETREPGFDVFRADDGQPAITTVPAVAVVPL